MNVFYQFRPSSIKKNINKVASYLNKGGGEREKERVGEGERERERERKGEREKPHVGGVKISPREACKVNRP